MASVPLNCNICPKQPTFSDISHLLTHVGSKGHLSHYFKAQVRAPQSPAVRQQLDTYEQWYKEHQIEKLLSQRMILKDSKKPNGTTGSIKRERSASKNPSKSSKAAGQKQNPFKPRQPPPGADLGNVIDPQLSQLSSAIIQQAAAQKPSPAPSSPALDPALVYPISVPRMRTFPVYAPTAESNHRWSASSVALAATEGGRDGADTESEDDAFDRRKSARPMYPEPPIAETLPAFRKYEAHGESSLLATRGRPRRRRNAKEEDLEIEEDFMPKTPELKGICYPGMSLFDSASPDAQRKRNQRKDDSLIAQIEQESLEVECNEYIYWPDGALKLCRYITGDVQSSPPKEDTPPPPPPPKRRRGRKPKLADATTAQTKPRKVKEPQAPEEKQPDPVKRETSLSQSMQWAAASPVPINTHSNGLGHPQAPHPTEDEEDQWLVEMGGPIGARRRITPMSLDEEYNLPVQLDDLVKPLSNPLKSAFRRSYHEDVKSPIPNDSMRRGCTTQGEINSRATSARLVLNPVDTITAASTKRSAPTAQREGPEIPSGKENIPPVGHYAGHRTSHRYFVAKSNHEAQMSTTLPAEMAFAGMETPPVYRISLNPLHPSAHLRQCLPYSSNYTAFQAPQRQACYTQGTKVTEQSFASDDEAAEGFDPEAFIY